LGDVAVLGEERRQVFDLPRGCVEVTEYRAARKACPGCGRVHTALFPEAVKARTQYGARFNSVMAHLHGTHLLPCARVAELCGELYGHRPGVAAVVSSMEQAARRMEPAVALIAGTLVGAGTVHADETGVRCEGKTRWVHVCSNKWLTHLSFGGQRGAKGFGAAGILERFAGLLVHDFWSAYLALPCRHGYCNAHLLRELKFMKEQAGHAWGGQISAVLSEMKAAAAQALETTRRKVPAAVRHKLRQRYDQLVAGAQRAHPPNTERKHGKKRGRIKQSPEHSLLRRLGEHRDEILRFFDEPGVPFDNNQAERDLRMLKVQQKTSGCFRTKRGATTFCTVRSYVSTARKHGLNLLDSIFNALLGSPFTVSPVT
jgi:transposase